MEYKKSSIFSDKQKIDNRNLRLYLNFKNEKNENILNFLKEIVHIDVSKISLMELTNTHIKEENVPLFVFETEQKNQREELGEGYIWEEPGQMRSVLGTYEVEGVPFF